MKRDALAIKSDDNVATALRDLRSGETVTVGIDEQVVTVVMVDDVTFGHKLAISAIDAGQSIIKYGEIIGRATLPIPAGRHAHVQNIESLRGRGDLE
ncbi:MAG: UxaA family hydrolase [Desulfobulbaceae bacterium]|nr:UxaA family hydrolase [Desulfobulbaceae bacterium]